MIRLPDLHSVWKHSHSGVCECLRVIYERGGEKQKWIKENSLQFHAKIEFTYGQKVEIDGLVAPWVEVAIAYLTCRAMDFNSRLATPGYVHMDGELIHQFEHQLAL